MAALDDPEEFAHLEGEDEFGQAFSGGNEVPSAMREPLDENGEYEMPSFIGNTVWRAGQECWVTQQTPLPESIHTCPQTVNVQLTYTCDGSNQFNATLPITLFDMHPPVITAGLVSGDTPHVSFGNVMRYPAAAAVLPVIDVTDPCGVSAEYLLNGVPYTLGTPIIGDGLYFLNIRAEDSSEDLSAQTIVFEIRERPSFTAAAVVEETDCTIENGELTSISVRLLVASNQFTPDEVLRTSLRMILRAPDGGFLAMQPMVMNVVEFNDCWSVVDVGGVVQYSYGFQECPSEVYVLGVGVIDGLIAFEWGALAPNVADPNALDTLAGMAGIDPLECDGPGQPPEPSPCDDSVGCKPVVTYIVGGSKSVLPKTGVCGGRGHIQALAQAGEPEFNAWALAYSRPPASTTCLADTLDWGATGVEVWVLQYVGDCCDCSATFKGYTMFDYEFLLQLSPNPPAGGGAFDIKAVARGCKEYTAPCGTATNNCIPHLEEWLSHPGVGTNWTPFYDEVFLQCVAVGCTDAIMVAEGSVGASAKATVTSGSVVHDAWVRSWVKSESNGSIEATAQPCIPCAACPCQITVENTFTFDDPDISGAFYTTYTLQKVGDAACLYEVIDVVSSHTIECCDGTVDCYIDILENASGGVWWYGPEWRIDISGPSWTIAMPGGPVLPCHNYSAGGGVGIAGSLESTQCPSGCVELDAGWFHVQQCIQ